MHVRAGVRRHIFVQFKVILAASGPYCSVPQIRYTKVRLRRLGGFGGRPHTQGLARWLSWLVATLVPSSISPASAELCPAKASRRNTLHHPSCRLSQHAPTGMKTCFTLGWFSSHSLTGGLLWLERLSVIK